MQIKLFSQKHPIIFNAILILATAIVLLSLSFLAMNIFTQHGQSQEVPDVKGKPLREAIAILEGKGLKWEISDSTYNDSYSSLAALLNKAQRLSLP